MNKSYIAAASVLAVLVGWGQSTLAQQPMDKAAPVEFFACNYQDGKGLADLEKVGKKFSEWSDKNNSKYSAWIMTPQLQTDVGFEVGWLGAWPDGNAFGKSQDTWMASGRELAEDFSKVIDCRGQHQMASSAVVNAPKGPPGNGVVMFAECTVQEGKTPADALPAHRKLGAEMKAMGSNGSSWLFYPGIGTGDIDFTYWSVIAFGNYTDLGAAMELYTNGGGWKKSMAILGPVTRCGSPSLFDARLVRSGPTS